MSIDYSALKFQYETRDAGKARALVKILISKGFVAVLGTTENVFRDLDGNVVSTKPYGYSRTTEIHTNASRKDLDEARAVYAEIVSAVTEGAIEAALSK